jgi:hypothetical protein
MINTTKPPLTIDGVEYDTDTLTDQQRALLDHVVDLERKVNSARFNLDQLQVGRDAFFGLLKQALTEKPEEAVSDVEAK